VTDPAYQYEYHDSGDLKKKTDARGRWVQMEYDVLGRITKKTYGDGTPAATETTYLFADMLGSVRTVTDAGGAVVECRGVC
jgi:uncharacterized protein RhaS with RHS repeats